MGVSDSYLTKSEVQRLLGVTTFGMRRLARKYDKFPKPTERPYSPFNREESQEVWNGTEVYSWAAKTAELAHRGALLRRPLPEDPAPGRWGGYKDTVRGPALDWHTALGVIREGELPATWPKDGRVAWTGGGSLARPLTGADESYQTLAGARVDGKPRLTVTGVKLGEMSVASSRGPATVPAWLFDLKGYGSPLKQAAVIPSKLPQPPIERSRDIAGHPLNQLVQVSADGRSVTVVALHGACDDGPVVDVLETRGSVVLSASVKDRKDDGDCTKQLLQQQVTVKLDRSVGDRVLLDAHTGRPVPYKPPHGPSPSWS
ncbi:hypothetical protein [Streptomyces jumonjinensis]|uniref:hypothetical protein n=1 Tax=Streptomyces jumonjinensis TaxID=1945 RepID=UPI0037A0CB49